MPPGLNGAASANQKHCAPSRVGHKLFVAFTFKIDAFFPLTPINSGYHWRMAGGAIFVLKKHGSPLRKRIAVTAFGKV